MRATLFIAVFAMVAWTVAYNAGKNEADLGSWALLVGLLWGLCVGGGIAVYSRVIDR